MFQQATLSRPADAGMSVFAETIFKKKYAHVVGDRRETWPETARRVAHAVMDPFLPDLADGVERLIADRKFMPGGRYLYAAGRKYPQVNNCFLFSCQEDSREEWGRVADNAINALMTGGGVGVVYSRLRGAGVPIRGLGGKSTGPCALMQIINEAGRHIIQGDSRRSAIWAGLHWSHADVFKFISLKDWPEEVRRLKGEDFNFPARLDGTNISVILDDEFFAAYRDGDHPRHDTACDVYWASVRGMLRSGEPGFSVDVGDNDGENLRNACTEVSSRDDGDMCNLGSLNLARIGSAEEFAGAVNLGTAFLLCGTVYSKLPMPSMYRTREKNRRVGLGLMGVHEWMLARGQRYGASDELSAWMRYFTMSGSFANRWADKLSISRPVATRSIAPTGTISIVAETTSGIEPIFAVAQKRRYLGEGGVWKAQYIVDATAHRLIGRGVDPGLIEDSMTLAEDVERRMSFQAWLQGHVDHGISSTINLPPWGSSLNNESNVTRFGNTLLKYLPRLRGITAYPDGARDGQPLVKATYREAISQLGVEFEDGSDKGCKGGVCGT